MELTRKQIILIAAVSGAILLLTAAAVLISTAGEEAASAGPTASPTATASPCPTPEPTETPAPTVFRLPLVPQGDTPRPSADPVGTGVFAPQVLLPEGTAGPWVDAGERTRDILAVGLREGRAAALLLLRLSDDQLTVAALPGQAAALAGEGPKEQGQAAAERMAAATGRPWEAWMALDLRCLPAVLAVTGPLGERGGADLSAAGVLDLAAGALAYVRRVSLLKLPALRRAVGDGFAASLSTWELWRLFWTVRSGAAVRMQLVPGEGVASPSNFFPESS